jgi:hypothetical protein
MEPVHVHIPYPQMKDFCELVRLRRYDLEIYMSAAVLDQVEKTDLENLCRSLDWKPSISLHAPFMDLNPGAVDPMVRSVTQLRFSRILSAAAVLKPRVVVFHAGYDRWRYNGRTDICLENSIDTWSKVMDTASKIGVRVAVENVFDEDPEALCRLIERVGHPDFGFCFDTGHFNLFTKVTMEQWFERLFLRCICMTTTGLRIPTGPSGRALSISKSSSGSCAVTVPGRYIRSKRTSRAISMSASRR